MYRSIDGKHTSLYAVSFLITTPTPALSISSESIQCAMLKACVACADMGQLSRCTDLEDFPSTVLC